MVDVEVLDEFVEWYEELEDEDRVAVTAAIDVLEVRGVALGFPRSSALEGRSSRCESCASSLRESPSGCSTASIPSARRS